MRYLKYGLMIGIFVLCAGYAYSAHAHVAVQVGPFGMAYGPGAAYVGPPPNCAYGYYGYYPYACAPYGYYGSDYFYNGVFWRRSVVQLGRARFLRARRLGRS